MRNSLFISISSHQIKTRHESEPPNARACSPTGHCLKPAGAEDNNGIKEDFGLLKKKPSWASVCDFSWLSSLERGLIRLVEVKQEAKCKIQKIKKILHHFTSFFSSFYYEQWILYDIWVVFAQQFFHNSSESLSLKWKWLPSISCLIPTLRKRRNSHQ